VKRGEGWEGREKVEEDKGGIGRNQGGGLGGKEEEAMVWEA
jgi:hypothetical protein